MLKSRSLVIATSRLRQLLDCGGKCIGYLEQYQEVILNFSFLGFLEDVAPSNNDRTLPLKKAYKVQSFLMVSSALV
jgi:hypothetical protein